MWHDVHRNDDDQNADLDAQLRSPGEGSPTGSGDERDAFLRRSGDAPGGPRNGEPTARPVDAPRSVQDSSGRPIGIALTASTSAVTDSGAFGHKLRRLPEASHGGRHFISCEQLAEAPVSPHRPDFPKSPEEAELGPDVPLLPPPAFNLNVSHGSRKSLLPSERSMTPASDPESAMLYTAQRVRVGKNAVPSSSSGASWLQGLGIPKILRRSWLSPKPRSETPTALSTNTLLLARPLTDNELQAGRSLNAQMRTELGYRDGARPVSGVSGLSTGSGRSGNTVFYDAQSREDVASRSTPLVPPPPQGTTSTGRSGPAAPSPLSAEPICAPYDSEGPPAYEPTALDTSQKEELTDYLDVPVPRPASPFVSVSSTKALSPPPGLALPNPHVWRDSATTPSNTSSGVDIDLLEEAPPAAGESWRQLAQGVPSLHERRTTFGLVSPSQAIHPYALKSHSVSFFGRFSFRPSYTRLSLPSPSTRALSRLETSSRSLTQAQSPRPTVASCDRARVRCRQHYPRRNAVNKNSPAVVVAPVLLPSSSCKQFVVVREEQKDI